MRDYSLPPYDVVTIGMKVAELCKEFGVNCKLGIPDGCYGIPFLSEALVEIASKNNLKISVTGSLAETGRQLQQVLNHLGRS